MLLHGLIEGTISVKGAIADGEARLVVGAPTHLSDLLAMFAPAESAGAVAA